jgi:hypothetical protein
MNHQPDHYDMHYMYRNIQHYNIKRVNKLNHAMRIAESVCKKTVKEKTEAFREWVKAIREALKCSS